MQQHKLTMVTLRTLWYRIYQTLRLEMLFLWNPVTGAREELLLVDIYYGLEELSTIPYLLAILVRVTLYVHICVTVCV